ncbi:hypothetical protein CcaCcLH18_10597 [Colletotrichum camelliae]|nr:hypothetical protein CcaCcLH18_10597 [Colletotrichum camelliae]
MSALRKIPTVPHLLATDAGIRTLAQSTSQEEILAIADLFERAYWKRLWVVQEIFYAQAGRIYCGTDFIGWSDNLLETLALFNKAEWKQAINQVYPPGSNLGQGSRSQYSFAQILATQGPQSLLYRHQMPAPITVMRFTRSKLAARPQDKVLGVLSLLGQNIRSKLQPDFNFVPKEAFTEVVRSIIAETGSLDIICEAIRYPFHQEIFDLPSWVADWSYAPDISSLAATNLEHRGPFKASGDLKWCKDIDDPTKLRDEIKISMVPLGTISARGMAVGTLGRLTNYLMAFLEWRHLIMATLGDEDQALRQAFCRTLCLGDVPSELDIGCKSRELKDAEWAEMTYFLFAMFLTKRLGRLPLDPDLERYRDLKPETKETRAREVI